MSSTSFGSPLVAEEPTSGASAFRTPHTAIEELFGRLKQAAEDCRFTSDVGELLTGFFRFLPMPAWLKVVQSDGTLLMAQVNRAYEREIGVTQAEYAARPDRAVWSSDTAAQFELHDREVMETGRAITVEESGMHQVTGVLMRWTVTKWPVVKNGRIVAICGIALPGDLT